jgi:peptidoglycan/xylan/chitin deacetylase (PgdA/CDA1 family)
VANFRTDRVATLYFVRPFRHLTGAADKRRIPILMYHSISDGTSEGIHPYFVTETSPTAFDAHMRYLAENGYSTITPGQLVTLLGSQQERNLKHVVVTFDDGYRDFYTRAFPILKKYGLSATVYLPSSFIERTPKKFTGRDCLTWDEVRELRRGGIEFGSHTMTHPKLKFLPAADLEREIRMSKETIENELGESIDSFSYPYAFPEENHQFVRRLSDLLKECGYGNGVSTIIGSVQTLEEKYFLKRLPANSCDDLQFFQAKLEGDYDWLRSPQYLKKLMRKEGPENGPMKAQMWDSKSSETRHS